MSTALHDAPPGAYSGPFMITAVALCPKRSSGWRSNMFWKVFENTCASLTQPTPVTETCDSVCAPARRLASSTVRRQVHDAATLAGSSPASSSKHDGGSAYFRLPSRRQALLPLVAFAMPARRFNPPWSAPSSDSEGMCTCLLLTMETADELPCVVCYLCCASEHAHLLTAGVHKPSPWLQLLHGSQPQQAQQSPEEVTPQPDPATGARC